MPGPLPSTALVGGVPFAIVSPHAETHDVAGTDPVLGSIRYLGSVTKTNTFDTASATYVDLTDMSLTVYSRGGTLDITFCGEMYASAGISAAPGAYMRALIDATTLTETIYQFSLGLAGANTIISPVSVRWITTAAIGPHTIKLQMHRNSSGSNAGINTSGLEQSSLVVLEYAPARRG